MRRFRTLGILLLLVQMIGSEVAWALTVQVLADGSHQVFLRASASGGLDILLHHDDDDESGVSHATAASTRRAHHHQATADHHDHVVTLPGSARCSTTAIKQTPPNRSAARLVAVTLGNETLPVWLLPKDISSGVSPPPPSRSSILRI